MGQRMIAAGVSLAGTRVGGGWPAGLPRALARPGRAARPERCGSPSARRRDALIARDRRRTYARSRSSSSTLRPVVPLACCPGSRPISHASCLGQIMPGAGDNPKLEAWASVVRRELRQALMTFSWLERSRAEAPLGSYQRSRLVGSAVLLLIERLGIERARARGNAGQQGQGDEGCGDDLHGDLRCELFRCR